MKREKPASDTYSDPGDAPTLKATPNSPVIRICDGLETVIEVIGRWTSWTALILVLLVATNVILRYLFRIGPVALQELEWHLMSPIALIGMSYAMRHGDHVRVDIFFDKFPEGMQRWIDLIASIATVIIGVALVKLSLGFVEQSYAASEISPDPGGLPYRFLLKSFIPLGFFLVFLEAVAQTLRRGLRMWGDGNG